MILESIDKIKYRKTLNRVIVSAIAALFILALCVSSLLIHFIGKEDGSNFTLNLIGVVVAACIVGVVLSRLRTLPSMHEVFYVWRLKQELNAIHRSSAKIKTALELNNRNAIIVSYFNLKASIQLYELDDNDLTLGSVRRDLSNLEERIRDLGLLVSTDDYHRNLLTQLDETQ